MAIEPLICTADVENGSDVVTVHDAVLTPANCIAPAGVLLAGMGYSVKARLTTLSFQLSRAYEGEDALGVTCEIAPWTSEMSSRVELSKQLRDYSARLALLDAYGKGLFFRNLGVTGANDPGPGCIARNDEDWADTTQLYFDVLDAGGQSAVAFIDLLDAGDVVTVRSLETAAYATFLMNSPASNQGPGEWRKMIDLSFRGQSGALVDGEDLAIEWNRAGPAGTGLSFDASGSLAGRDAHDAAAKDFSYLSLDGDGDTIDTAVIFVKLSADDADWSDAIPVEGPRGLSAYQVALANGFVGSEAAWVASLVGEQGEQGGPGADSEVPGPPNTLTIGTVEIGDEAAAELTGDAPAQVLNLVLPKGDAGNDGNDGAAATIAIGSVTTVAAGEPATATNSGTSGAAVFDFEIPAGQRGETGPANTIIIGTVESGVEAAAEITGDAPDQVLNLVLPKGDAGDAATIAIGTVTTLEPGEDATVVNVGTEAAAVLNISIPKGPPGSGSVDSVNGDHGPDIVLDSDDIDDTGKDHKWMTADEKAAIAALDGKSATDFATAVQGGKADSAVQPGDLADVATSGEYDDLVGAPTLGTAAALDAGSSAGNVPVLGGGGLLDESILPALAITDTFEVASQVAMLALTAQRGDIAVRSDLNKTFILKTAPATTLANWVELRTPTDAVLSVAALTGAITAAALKTALSLGKGDVGLGNVDNTADSTKNAAAATLTNKRITARVTSATSSGTPAPNADADDQFELTAQAAAAAFVNPSGTPTDGQKLMVRIKDNATARAISWGTAYRAMGTALPLTTAISKTLYVGFIYNAADSKWDCVATALEG